uniref:Uncharacterized protein n=1 Tax=Arundo donax TaxID=35708 RepID=A0A0A9EF71_ARUDO
MSKFVLCLESFEFYVCKIISWQVNVNRCPFTMLGKGMMKS